MYERKEDGVTGMYQGNNSDLYRTVIIIENCLQIVVYGHNDGNDRHKVSASCVDQIVDQTETNGS